MDFMGTLWAKIGTLGNADFTIITIYGTYGFRIGNFIRTSMPR